MKIFGRFFSLFNLRYLKDSINYVLFNCYNIILFNEYKLIIKIKIIFFLIN